MNFVRELKSFVKFVALWLATVGGGAVLQLLFLSCIGYLGYSDRPGPGWGAPRLPSIGEVQFLAGWMIPFLLPTLAIYGSLLFASTRMLGYLGAPVWLVRIVGGFCCGVVALFAVAAAGWYIALAPIVVTGAGLLGLLFGLFVFPRFGVLRRNGGMVGCGIPLWQWFHSRSCY